MRSFISAVIAVAATIAATGVAAQTPEARTFTRDGRTYTYTQVTRADGSTLLEGQEHATNGRFRLVVANGRVSGISNGRAVSFRAPVVTATTLAAN